MSHTTILTSGTEVHHDSGFEGTLRFGKEPTLIDLVEVVEEAIVAVAAAALDGRDLGAAAEAIALAGDLGSWAQARADSDEMDDLL